MATAGEYEPAKVVALWRPRTGDDVHIVPPCGWCRQFLFELQPKNGSDMRGAAEGGHGDVVVLGLDFWFHAPERERLCRHHPIWRHRYVDRSVVALHRPSLRSRNVRHRRLAAAQASAPI